MSRSADVLVVGSGVIGLTAAYDLALHGLRVAVCDQGPLGQGASWAGAGIIPAKPNSVEAPPIDQLQALSSRLFPGLSADLRERTGIDNGYRACGGIEFGTDEVADEWGVRGTLCDEARLTELEPNLASGLAPAFQLPGLAQVRSPRHVKALIAAVMSLGVELLPDWPIDAFRLSGSRIHEALSGSHRLVADHYLICAGAWSGNLLDSLNCRLPVTPVRGQMLLLRLPKPPLTHVLVYGRRYVVPRDDGRVLVGSTEDHVGFDTSTVDVDLAGLRRFVDELIPCLASANSERFWAGLRPGTPDGLPYLGRLPNCANGWIAAGHFRSGISLSPGTAQIASQLIRGVSPVIPVAAFGPERASPIDRAPAFRT